MKGISIIICCYNSEERLAKTLECIALQKFNKEIKAELIVVDNNSSDRTIEVAKKTWQKYSPIDITIKIVSEKKPGLIYARNKGVQSAAYDFIIFCDDDNLLFEDFLEVAYELMVTEPKTGIIGSLSILKSESTPPLWFDKYKGYFAVGPQNNTDGIIEGNSPYVFGAGCVIRRSVFIMLEKLNFSFLAVGREGDKLSSGEDVEICYVIKLLGLEIGYSSRLRFYHHLNPQRLNEQYILKLAYHFGYCNILHRPYFWLLNKDVPFYKKNFVWTFLISANIYLISLLNYYIKSPDQQLSKKINLQHAKGRLDGAISLNFKINQYLKDLALKFKL